MTAVATPDAARLVFAAVAGLILLLILIIKFKVHAMISILIGAVGIGLMAGMPLSDIIGSVNEGIGNTLKGIALLVGLGSMFGAILEESGGAQTLVEKFIDSCCIGKINHNIRFHITVLQRSKYWIITLLLGSHINSGNNRNFLIFFCNSGNNLTHRTVAAMHNCSYHLNLPLFLFSFPPQKLCSRSEADYFFLSSVSCGCLCRFAFLKNERITLSG